MKHSMTAPVMVVVALAGTISACASSPQVNVATATQLPPANTVPPTEASSLTPHSTATRWTTPTPRPSATRRPTSTATNTAQPQEMTQTAAAAYQETRTARQAATQAFTDRLKEYARVDAINDFLGYPGNWSGQKIVIRGEVYEIEGDGWEVHLYLKYGYNGDFILVNMESPLTLESGVMQGYMYNVYGIVEPCGDIYNLKGYCINEALIPSIRE